MAIGKEKEKRVVISVKDVAARIKRSVAAVEANMEPVVDRLVVRLAAKKHSTVFLFTIIVAAFVVGMLAGKS